MILTVEFDPNEDPFLHQTASFSCPTSHQSLVFLPKILCDVKRVEVGYGVRLCASSIEPLVFKIPRVKVNLLHFLSLMLFHVSTCSQNIFRKTCILKHCNGGNQVLLQKNG